MRPRLNKPVLSTQLDLGFRPDHLVPRVTHRAKATREAKALALGLPLLLLAAFVSVLIGLMVGAPALTVVLLPLFAPLLFLVLAKSTASDRPTRVIRVSERKSRRAVLVLSGLAPTLVALLAVSYAVEPPNTRTIAAHSIVLALVASLTIYGWRNRDALPSAVREIRDRVEPNETCVADAVAAYRLSDRSRKTKAVIVATDRRLLICRFARGRSPMTSEYEYSQIAVFGRRWNRFGLQGELELSTSESPPRPDGRVSHTFSGILPSNLALFVSALREHGVAGPELD